MLLFFIKALVALFTVIDPIGLAPSALPLIAHMAPEERAQVITRAALIAAAVLAIFGVFGQAIFASLGVTAAAFSIAGGALLFLVAIDMLFGRQSGARETAREAREARQREDVSVFPLAIPLIAGPGAITTVILLVTNANGQPLLLGSLAIAALLTLTAAWIALRLCVWIQKRIGSTGSLVLSRVQGMLLAAVAAQFILNGVSVFLRATLR